jgi:PAS domain S-box-containing protein
MIQHLMQTGVARRVSHTSVLTRMRWLFLVMIVTSNVSQVPITVSSVATGPIAAGAMLWLVASSFWLYRRGRPHPAADIADCCALLVMGACGAGPSTLVSTTFPIVYLTSTYGSTRRVVLRSAGFFGAYAVAKALSPDFDVRLVPGEVISLAALAGVMHLLTRSFTRNARSLTFQRTLATAGARLVAARTRAEVYEAALQAALELRANDESIAATFLEPADQNLLVVGARGSNADLLLGRRFAAMGAPASTPSIRLPAQVSPFTEVLITPLAIAGELVGAIALASPTTIPDDTEGALLALAAETVLALETLASSERFRSLVQNSSDVFTIVAPDLRVIYQSPSFAKLTDGPPEATLGEPIAALLHLQDGNQLVRQLEERSTSTIQLQLRWRHADGHWRQTESIVSNLLDDPSVKGWIVNSRDVSERARLEMELHQAQKLEAIGRLAGGMAHEINTPMQFVGDNLRFLKTAIQEVFSSASFADGGPDLALFEQEIPQAIDESLEGLQRVAGIVLSLQQFAHPAARELVSADLNEALLSTLTVARGELRDVAEVRTDLGDLPPVRCYLGELNQVFLNLIVNAAHAVTDVAPAQGIIVIRSRRDGHDVVISIQDNGCGIPEAIRTQVFDPFFTTRQVGHGTGQGLAVARSIIVDKHGGSIDFTSATGKGTTFVIRLAIAGAAGASDRLVA